MGFMTLSDFRSTILANPFLQDKPSVDHTLVDVWINLGYFEVTGAIEFEALKRCARLPTIIGVDTYVLPTSFVGMISVVDVTTGGQLLKTPLDHMQRLTSSQTGYPKRWARKADGVMLWPTPDAVYSLLAYFIAEPTRLSNAADRTVLPGTWDQSILLLALHNAMLMFNQLEAADRLFTRAMANMRSRLTDEDLNIGPQGGIDVARGETDLVWTRPSSERLD